ncbi:MAG: DsbA family oxidoreductase [Burkholderiales bacterium]|nr:DsbA family oxidoreductase [Burkholderiales bacterium]
MTQALTIDIISDVVCPWCYIGKRRLEQALAQYATAHPDAPPPEVRWRPFQLNPDMPLEGITRAEYIRRKFGPNGGANYKRVSDVGAGEGLEMDFDGIKRQPNSLPAHTLIDLAAPGEEQDRVVEALFNAYFVDNVDFTNTRDLVEVAVAAGLERLAVEARLADTGAIEEVRAADEEARGMGISGVPFFIFNRRVALSGAHEPSTMLEAIRQAETAEVQ